MEYLTSKWQDYHPIFMGAGCLALGYTYGWHCKSMVENHHIHNVPIELDATCNHVTSHAMPVEPKRGITIQEPTSCPSDSTFNYLDKNIGVTLEKSGKRPRSQLEIFQMPRKNEGTLLGQSSAFKKKRGIPTIIIQKKAPIIQSKAELAYDSDDEILATRLDYFTKQSASINKPSGSNHVLKLGKKRKKTTKSTTESMTVSSKEKDSVTTDLQKSSTKTSTRSKSGLCDLVNLYGECSLEETHKSSKTAVCLENVVQVEETTFAHTMVVTEPEPMPCAQALELAYAVSNHVQEHIGGDSVGLMDSQCELSEAANDLDYIMDQRDEEERLQNVSTEDGVAYKEEDLVGMERSEEKMSTSQSTEFHGIISRNCLCTSKKTKGGASRRQSPYCLFGLESDQY